MVDEAEPVQLQGPDFREATDPVVISQAIDRLLDYYLNPKTKRDFNQSDKNGVLSIKFASNKSGIFYQVCRRSLDEGGVDYYIAETGEKVLNFWILTSIIKLQIDEISGFRVDEDGGLTGIHYSQAEDEGGVNIYNIEPKGEVDLKTTGDFLTRAYNCPYILDRDRRKFEVQHLGFYPSRN